MSESPSKAAARIVLLGANGFVGKALLAKVRADGRSIRPIPSAEINLTRTGARQRLGEILESDNALVFASAITPDKGKDTSAFVNNIAMGNEVAQALRAAPVAKVIYISSDAVFAEDLPPITEATLPCPNGLYGIMHLAREKMLEEVCAAQGIKLLILRPCAIYGPGDTHNSYGPNRFIRSALRDGTIRLFGNGEECRPHLFIDDFVDVLVESSRNAELTGVLHPIPETSHSFMEVAQEIAHLLKLPKDIECLPRGSKPSHKTFARGRMHRDLPHLKLHSLQEGLANSISGHLGLGITTQGPCLT